MGVVHRAGVEAAAEVEVPAQDTRSVPVQVLVILDRVAEAAVVHDPFI